jgi:hypothetical protein
MFSKFVEILSRNPLDLTSYEQSSKGEEQKTWRLVRELFAHRCDALMDTTEFLAFRSDQELVNGILSDGNLTELLVILVIRLSRIGLNRRVRPFIQLKYTRDISSTQQTTFGRNSSTGWMIGWSRDWIQMHKVGRARHLLLKTKYLS